MSENSGRYSYVLLISLITFMVILLGFIGEIFNTKLDRSGIPGISCTKLERHST